MQKVRIITHSGCDLSYREAEELNIIMIPDMVIFEGQEYRNNIDIHPEAFYSRLEQNETLPTSAHPNAADFMNAFRAADCEDIICITATSLMTGTYNTANLAAQLLKEEGFSSNIHIYDSKQISFGMAYSVLEAAQMAKAGATVDQILGHLDEMLPNIGVYFIMKSLKYARKGGRIGAIRAITADTLGVKPLLVFGDGTVSDISLNRTFGKGIRSIFQKYKTYAGDDPEVFIFHANNEKDARTLKELLQQDFPNINPRIEWVGPVIGIYTGVGCVGIAFKKKES